MKTKAVRLYGKMDLRLEEFELPEIKDDEILVKVSADSLCMSSYKAAKLGEDHKRVPDDVADNPIIIGHELSGEIVQIGEKWQGKYKAGEKFSLQPAINYKGSMDSPGYSYKYCGGDATYMILPPEVMIMNCLLPYRGEGYFNAALSEPYSCVIGACRSLYRTDRQKHIHYLGIKEGGRMAILGGCGPMGLAAIDYALAGEFRPRQLIVTDLDNQRLQRAQSIFGPIAEKRGISLLFINSGELDNPHQFIMRLTENEGFDDMLVMVPFADALELGESLLGFNGCMNFFAGPTDEKFSARLNYYDVHYTEKHIIGTTGGNVDDMTEALELMESGLLSPEVLVTHIGGLDAVAEATLNLPAIPGGKKLIYTGLSLPLTALNDLPELAENSRLFKELAEIVKRNNGLWSVEAENYLLENGEKI
ncbi:zinc-binding dehydrogenase [Spirochaeta isovalerica]|uniref:Threonine dehydrogenase-like Zn-dependent dehydrogenase n=1 Tax=Spirochaeta isovalerica TaxID=150 RepID=A0A841R9A0_9SPIO|nr:zinc-binding dehydrogenase [Spirochaeta isovalerica]MBB6480356.1 threonine dehydrogenase-like Zn-dependent dehydrogenase [Spirochaeta isovalerica]